MQRRRFLAQAAGAAGAGLAAVGMPAVAQSAPAVRWRMSTSWPKSLDTIYGSAEDFCKRVAQLTEGKFEIRAFRAASWCRRRRTWMRSAMARSNAITC